jgi:hypothetical protein
MSNYEKIDPVLGNTLSQLIYLKREMKNLTSVDTLEFLSSLDVFINLIGNKIQEQALSGVSWEPDI